VELLAEGSSHTVPAEVVHLDAWVADREIPYTTAIDPTGVGMRIVQELAPRDTLFVVELETMKILLRASNVAAVYAELDGL
jgi:hypothetical protein